MRDRMLKVAMVLAVLLAGGAVARAQETSEQKKTVVIEGSTTVGPIAEGFAEAFMKARPGVKITVNKTGSGDGAAALIDSRCDIAAMSRFMKDKEFKDSVAKGVAPVAHAVAMDGVCVVVHPSNPVKKLTIEQVNRIYKGEITNWKDVGGVDAPIVVVSRDTSSGTYETFVDKVMGKDKMAGGVEYVSSNPQAHTRVKSTAGAIGYVGLAFVDKDVAAVSINGVTPSRKTIASGAYPIARPLFLFTNGYPAPGSLLFDLVTFHLSEKGQEIIEAKGFVPLTNY